MTTLAKRWQAFSDRPFPAEARSGEVAGVNLNDVDTFATMHIERLLHEGSLDLDPIGVLLDCRCQLAQALPALSGETHDYFAELESLLGMAIGMAANDSYKFTNITGVELSRLLERLLAERLPRATGQEELQSALGAALIVVANVLKGPVDMAENREQTIERMVAFSAKWLRNLLQPAPGSK